MSELWFSCGMNLSMAWLSFYRLLWQRAWVLLNVLLTSHSLKPSSHLLLSLTTVRILWEKQKEKGEKWCH